MLFDLRGRGRRNTIKVIYVSLAILMGGGLVLFGIGGDVSGGLVDAITGSSSGGDDGTSRFVDRERKAAARTRANPQDAQAWADLARARYQQAGIGENFDPSRNAYTAKGRAKLQGAADAWVAYQKLDPPAAKASQVARIMVQVYGPGALEKPEEATAAQEIVAEANPKANTYAQLAQLAYAAGQKRKGDLAKDKAIQLAPKDEREALKGQLESAAAQASPASSPIPTPAASATPSPSGG
ncbi:MAG TPA: hypothetical protein VF533_14025 [Solirubrobacteraceae bacterium]|jgi:hypothetical protein